MLYCTKRNRAAFLACHYSMIVFSPPRDGRFGRARAAGRSSTPRRRRRFERKTAGNPAEKRFVV